jgi:regulator of replication initiation timing
MKKIALLLLLSIAGFASRAQTVSIETGIEELGEGFNQAFRISVPHIAPDDLEKSWRSFIKKNGGKVKTSKKGIRGENVIIHGLGHDTLQFFSRIIEDKDGSMLKVAVETNETIVTSASNPQLHSGLERVFRDFALNNSKQGLESKINIAVGLITLTNRNRTKLESENKRLEAENERMKKAISDNEAKLEDNKKKIENLIKQGEEQGESLKQLRSKTGELK